MSFKIFEINTTTDLGRGAGGRVFVSSWGGQRQMNSMQFNRADSEGREGLCAFPTGWHSISEGYAACKMCTAVLWRIQRTAGAPLFLRCSSNLVHCSGFVHLCTHKYKCLVCSLLCDYFVCHFIKKKKFGFPFQFFIHPQKKKKNCPHCECSLCSGFVGASLSRCK